MSILDNLIKISISSSPSSSYKIDKSVYINSSKKSIISNGLNKLQKHYGGGVYSIVPR